MSADQCVAAARDQEQHGLLVVWCLIDLARPRDLRMNVESACAKFTSSIEHAIATKHAQILTAQNESSNAA